MGNELTYIPVPKHRRFRCFEGVGVFDREGKKIGTTVIARIAKRWVQTCDGRKWSHKGEYYANGQSYPFPTIRVKESPNGK